MGEAKQRRRRAELGSNVSLIDDPREAMVRLTQGVSNMAGKPMSLTLFGAGLIPQAIQNGTLRAKTMAKKATAEQHLWRLAFMAWDRIRDPWECTLCGRDYSGLPMLSVLGIVDDPREAPRQNKPAVMALVCTSCDGVSTEETRRPKSEPGTSGSSAPRALGTASLRQTCAGSSLNQTPAS
jgi:hypothetical protein